MTPTLPYRVLLVDDHPMMRHGLRRVLEMQGGFAIAGEAGSGAEALELHASLRPDLVILDHNMPRMTGLETLRRLRQAGFAGKVLMYTVSDAEQDMQMAMLYGADGYLLKDIEPEDLLRQIRYLMQGRTVVATPGSARSPQQNAAEAAGLTTREQEVLQLIIAGHSNKLIGYRLGITEGTVKIHVKNLLGKLGLRTRVEALIWALGSGEGGREARG